MNRKHNPLAVFLYPFGKTYRHRTPVEICNGNPAIDGVEQRDRRCRFSLPIIFQKMLYMKEEIKVLKQTELLGQQFRVYGTLDEPLFKATDVARFINHSDVSTMMRNVDDDEKGTKIVCTPGGKQQVWMLTENGLYEVLMQSRKPIAKEFKKGVKAILKEIRTNGGYLVARADETPEEIMARALVVAKATIERQQGAILAAQKKAALLDATNQGLTKQVEGLERAKQYLLPGATFANAVKTSEHSILVGELARIIKQNGVEIGQNRLFAWLRDNGYLCKKGEMYNQPTQKAMGMGLFEIKKTVITKPNGDSLVTTTTKVTGKGQVYFVNKFLYDTINTDAIQSKASGMKEDVHTNTTTTATADNKKGGAQ